jgi:hypothetical protein
MSGKFNSSLRLSWSKIQRQETRHYRGMAAWINRAVRPERRSMIQWLTNALLFAEFILIFALTGAVIGALIFWKRTRLAWTAAIITFAGLSWIARSGILGSGRADVDFTMVALIADVFVGCQVYKAYERAKNKPRPPLSMNEKKRLVALAVSTVAAFTILDFSVWSQIKTNMRRLETHVVAPYLYAESVTETGHIYDVRREMDWTKRRWNVTWWVEIEATGALYYCDWDFGYSGFSKGDPVTFTHSKVSDQDESIYGFLEGLQKAHLRYTTVEGSEVDYELAPETPDEGPEP